MLTLPVASSFTLLYFTAFFLHLTVGYYVFKWIEWPSCHPKSPLLQGVGGLLLSVCGTPEASFFLRVLSIWHVQEGPDWTVFGKKTVACKCRRWDLIAQEVPFRPVFLWKMQRLEYTEMEEKIQVSLTQVPDSNRCRIYVCGPFLGKVYFFLWEPVPGDIRNRLSGQQITFLLLCGTVKSHPMTGALWYM